MSNTINNGYNAITATIQIADNNSSAADVAHDEFIQEMNAVDMTDQDNDDNDLYHGLANNNQKNDQNRKSVIDQYRGLYDQSHGLSDQVTPKHAGELLRINLSQRALQRELFEEHSRYAARLNGDGAADYFNAVGGEYCYLLGVFAVAFAYCGKNGINLDAADDQRLIENARFDSGLDANGRPHAGRPLPVLKPFSNALAEASHSERLVATTVEHLVQEFSSENCQESEYFAAIRLFETGEFSAGILARLINQSIANRGEDGSNEGEVVTATETDIANTDTANTNIAYVDSTVARRFDGPHDALNRHALRILLNGAIRSPLTACAVIASDSLTDHSLKQLTHEPSEEFTRLLDIALTGLNLSLDPAAVRIQAQASERIQSNYD